MFLQDFFKKIFKIKNNKVGLVLSGGGSRGFYHIGVINALRDMNVKIDRISGTSIGAIIGAMYASNPDIDFNKLIAKLDLFTVVGMIMSHIDKTPKSKLEDLFKKHITARDFKDFKIPFTFNAVDINNAKEIVFDKGRVFPEIFASMSIPGIFPPLEYNGVYLVDGSVLNNTPVKHIEKYCDKIIISDISTKLVIDKNSKNIDVLSAVIRASEKNNTIENILELKSIKNKKVVLIRLEEVDTHFLDFRKKNYKKLIERGYSDTIKKKNEILKK